MLPLFVALPAACGGKEDDEDQPAPTEQAGPAGCYIEAEHRCDCELQQAACEEVGMWVDMGCASCGT